MAPCLQSHKVLCTVVGVTLFFSKSLQHVWFVWDIVRVDDLKTKMVSAII